MKYETPSNSVISAANRWDQPVLTSLLDTDFYKFAMGNFIHSGYSDVTVEFSLINRDATLRLSDHVDLRAVADQLDHCRSLRFRETELDWLSHHAFYGQSGIFSASYIDFLRRFQLPEYSLSEQAGQIVLKTEAPWAEASMWEIPFLTIVSELRRRQVMGSMTRNELSDTYSRAESKLQAKLERLRAAGDIKLMDFGTRRRHSLHWQEHVVDISRDILKSNFTGTSNCLIAMRRGIEARGTVAHEISMVIAALASDDQALRASQYKACEQW